MKSLKIRDGIDTTGAINIQVLDKDGKVVYVWEDHNLIVEEGKTTIANILLGLSTESVGFISVGDDVTMEVDSNRYSVIKATAGRVLAEIPVTKVLIPATFLGAPNQDTLATPPVAKFTATIEEDELNGASLGEVMLVFNSKARMLSRKSLGSAITKAAGFKIQIVWFIVISS